jgi:hypothetical protein
MLTTCVGFSVPAIAEEPAGEVAANQASVEAARKLDTEEALSSLKRMSDFLAGQERFLLDAEIGWDTHQANGQRLEFGARSKVTVRRPDRFRFDVRNRDGRSSSILFDGKRIAMDFPQLEAYAAVEKPAQIDEALDYLTGSLEIPAPLSELMRRDLYAAVGGAVTYGLVVGDATLDRKECTHVAFRTSDRDIQVWIERGDRPLPVRLVITYIADEGTPQFWAQFLTWEIGVEAPDELFTYAPPDGAERLDFLAGAAAPDTKEAR